MNKYLPYLALTGLLVAACSPNESVLEEQPSAIMVDQYQFNENYASYLETLSSDEFEGRAPASEGERKTVEFVESKFREWGLQPYDAENNNYQHQVPLLSIIPTHVSSMQIDSVSVDDY